MKKLKIILLLFVVILLSGCSGTYNIKINEDLSVKENIDLTIPNENDSYEKTVELFEKNNIPKDNYDVIASDNNVKITYNEDYESIEDYLLNSKLYKNLFNNINFENDKKEIKLSTSSKLKLDGNTSDNIVDDYNISLLQINVETPYKVVENNADTVSDNIYSWVLNKDTTSKDINLIINIQNKPNTYISIVVLSLICIIVVGTLGVIFVRSKNTQKI